jgi:lysozyme
MPDNKQINNKTGLAKTVGSTAIAALLIGTVAVFEGKSNDPYLDIVRVPTVCYGETNVAMHHYTDAECEEMLAKSIDKYAKNVLVRAPNLKDHPYQLVAATSLSYNIGTTAFKNSTAAKKFAAGDLKGGCAALKRWNKAGGKVVQGLVNRRNAEYKICMKDL